MQAIQVDAKKAQVKWFSVVDAHRRSEAERVHFMLSEQIVAKHLPYDLARAYVFDKSYVTYRKNFVAVKVSNPLVKNKKYLKKLEKDLQAKGVVKVETKQGIIYRIPKK